MNFKIYAAVAGVCFSTLTSTSLASNYAGSTSMAASDSYVLSPLMVATMNGDITTVKKLINNGVDVNATNAIGDTALKCAKFKDNLDIAQILIHSGADTYNLGEGSGEFLQRVLNHEQSWSSAYVLPEGYNEAFENPLGDIDYEAELVNAADDGDLELVKELIEEGHPADTAGKFGITSLMRASYRGHIDVVQYLIYLGAEVNIVDEVGITAFASASIANHNDIKKLLIASGADETLYAKFEPAALPILVAAAASASISATSAAAMVGGTLAAAGAGAVIANNTGSNDFYIAPTPLGEGVKVAIIDNGVRDDVARNEGTHFGATYDFTDNNAYGVSVWDENSKDFVDASGENDGTVEDAGDMADHGTETAIIINNIVPNSEILSLRAFDSESEIVRPAAIAESIEYAIDNGAQVINNAWEVLPNDYTEPVAPTFASALLDTKEASGALDPSNGITTINNINKLVNIDDDGDEYLVHGDKTPVLVWAAGNSGHANPNITAGLYKIDFPFDAEYNVNAKLEDYWIVSAAVKDTNGDGIYTTEEAGSNKCGATQTRCVAAIANSTSHSSAQVSAAVAKLISSGLTTKQAAARALITATYLESDQTLEDLKLSDSDDKSAGNYDVSTSRTNSDTGHGLLDVTWIDKPIGELFVNTGGVDKKLLSGSRIKLGKAFGDAISNSGISFIAFDNGGDKDSEKGSAAFEIPLAGLVEINASRFNAENALQEFGEDEFAQTVQFGNATMEYSPYVEDKSAIISPDENPDNSGKLAFTIDDNSGSSYTFSRNVGMHKIFGYGAITSSDSSMSVSKVTEGNPYLNLVDGGMAGVIRREFNENVSLKLGVFSSEDKSLFYDKSLEGYLAEITVAYDDFNIALQSGVVNEGGTFLGGRTEGLFAIDSKTSTMINAISAQASIVPNLNIYGSYVQGTSTPTSQSNTLFTDISEIVSNSFSLGLTYNGFDRANTKVGFVVSQPLRIASGKASFSYDSALGADGIVRQGFSTIDLTPSGREIDLETYLTTDLDKDTSVKGSATYRREPGHNKNNKDDTLLMLKVLHKFDW